MTISYGLCWNIDSRKIIWPPRAHFGSENESLKGLITLIISEQYFTFVAPLSRFYYPDTQPFIIMNKRDG